MPNVILYGVLINEKSLYKTISPRKLKIINVKGYKRIFNLIPSRIELYQNNANQINKTVFNAIPDENSNFNALMANLNEEEFKLLKIRERSYNTKKIKIDNTEAYLFIGKKKLFGEEIIDNTLLPIHPYLIKCKEGAIKQGKNFYNNWLNTSFLGDGTKLREYMKKQNL